MIALKGATNMGSANIRATSQAATLSSTIMTRLRVPIIKAVVMPMVNLNRDSRISLPIGRSALATSANGR